MKKPKLFILLMTVFITTTFAADNQPVEWNSIEKSLSAVNPTHKFILVDIVAPWCGWCKKMDESTFTDDKVSEQLRTSFVTVKLDAEAATPITFNGKNYGLVQNGTRQANQLALDLGKVNGRLGYPTIVVLDDKGNKIQTFPGYKDAETLNVLLKYFLTNSYKTMDFQQFQSGQ